MKLPAAVKAAWLKALRRKKNPYKQGNGVLYDSHKQTFCCLGVLEHCVMDGNVEVSFGSFELMPSRTFWEHVGAKSYKARSCPNPDESAHSWEGKKVDVPTFLSKANDEEGWNFRKIANWIDKNIEAY